jgi:hypothetical protein
MLTQHNAVSDGNFIHGDEVYVPSDIKHHPLSESRADRVSRRTPAQC